MEEIFLSLGLKHCGQLIYSLDQHIWAHQQKDVDSSMSGLEKKSQCPYSTVC